MNIWNICNTVVIYHLSMIYLDLGLRIFGSGSGTIHSGPGLSDK